MNEALKERLNKILDRITSPEFLSNSGLGNEIGFYIFDYPPDAELEVRQHVDFVLDKSSKRKPELRIAGAKRALFPMSSVTDIPTIPGELFAKFQTSFYADPVDAVFKALGVD